MRRILTAALIAGALCAVAGCSAAPLVGEAEVEKGTVDGGAGTSLRVGSTADSCSGRPYGDGDQMLQAEPLRLFLTRAESGWTTLTPFDGARPVDDGATSRPSPGPSTPAPDD